jgi:microcystin-dependent protein
MPHKEALWMQGDVTLPLLDRASYTAQEDRIVLSQLWDEGVIDLTAFKVTQRAAGPNFQVEISDGVAVVVGDDQDDQGNYLVAWTDVTPVTLDAAPGANSRYDIIILRVLDGQAGGLTGDGPGVAFVKGTAAASPTVPTTPDSAILLAVIGPITSATSAITNSIITDGRTVAGRRCQPGTIEEQADSHLPSGWLWAAGQAVSRTTYARLFAHIGTTHGAGDGSTTFNVPDRRGRVGVGLDNLGGTDAGRLSAANTLGGAGGAETHTLSIGELPAHDHGLSEVNTDVEFDGSLGSRTMLSPTGTASGLETDSTGSGQAHNNLQPYLLLNYRIRT